MADTAQLLDILNTRAAAVSINDLAGELKASVEGTRKQLNRLKERGQVEGNKEEGWLITDVGKKALEKGGADPSMVDEAVTPRQKFESIGRLIGIKPERIALTSNIVWTADYEDLEWVWEALGQADIPLDARRVWVNSWRAYLQKAIPPNLAPALSGPEGKRESETTAAASDKPREGRSYMLIDDMPVFVGKDLGDLFYQDAVDLARIRAARSMRSTAQSTSDQQPMGVNGILELVKGVRDLSGPDNGQKSYVVTQGEDGAVVQEIDPRTPFVLNPSPGGHEPPPSYVVDSDGNVRQAQPGEPIVIRQQPAAASQKTMLIKQTPEGIVTEEVEAGKPVIINMPAASGPNMPPVMPFPVMGNDGQPVLDQNGHPVYANLEPMLQWLGFQGEQKRANERHGALMDLARTTRENLGDGISALKKAAEETKGSESSSTNASSGPPPLPRYECPDCKTQFTLPRQDFEKVVCPGCHKEWTREEVLAV